MSSFRYEPHRFSLAINKMHQGLIIPQEFIEGKNMDF